jgi:hypothetical protein
MEESGSEGLDDLIKNEAGPGKFFDGIDCFCIVSHPRLIFIHCTEMQIRSQITTGSTPPPLA